MTDPLATLARNGVLRAAINSGNRALVQVDNGDLRGVSPALARRLAARIKAELEPIVYSGAGKVFADADTGLWDIAFLAIDATRAQRVSFTRPYHVIEATYAVRAGSAIREVADADRSGIHVLTSTGSAYDMFLSANLQHATLEHSGTPGESFEEFRKGRCDAVAGVRASLERHFADDPTVRILPGILTRVEQAIVLPGAEKPAIQALDDFVAEAIECGFVATELGE